MDAFEKMGENPESPGYIKPSENDVWQFMRSVSKWVNEPSRLGL
jgi:hypothetical protein